MTRDVESLMKWLDSINLMNMHKMLYASILQTLFQNAQNRFWSVFYSIVKQVIFQLGHEEVIDAMLDASIVRLIDNDAVVNNSSKRVRYLNLMMVPVEFF